MSAIIYATAHNTNVSAWDAPTMYTSNYSMQSTISSSNRAWEGWWHRAKTRHASMIFDHSPTDTWRHGVKHLIFETKRS